MNKKLQDLALNVRSLNALKYAGVDTLEKLLKLTRVDLAKTPNLGKKSLALVEQALNAHGLSLKEPEPPQFRKEVARLALEVDRRKGCSERNTPEWLETFAALAAKAERNKCLASCVEIRAWWCDNVEGYPEVDSIYVCPISEVMGAIKSRKIK